MSESEAQSEENGFLWFMLGIAFVVVGITMVIAIQASRDADKAQRALCAWIIHEDGSASVRSDDFSRFQCRDDA